MMPSVLVRGKQDTGLHTDENAAMGWEHREDAVPQILKTEEAG